MSRLLSRVPIDVRTLTVGVALLCMCAAATAVEPLGVLDYKILPEASGLAVSRIDERRLWFINDSGNRAELVAYDYAEDHYTRVKVRKVKNRDWEDIASFSYRGEPWLAIGDVGDNDGKRKKVYIYLIPEPEDGDAKVSVHTTLTLTYPKGPRDVESIAVDSQTNTLYLLSKRESSPRLYSVALPDLLKGKKHELEAVRLGKVKSIPKPSKKDKKKYKYGEYRAQPTGMTLVPDGSAIAVMTYGGVFLARLGPDRDWLQALNENLCPVATPELEQAESIAADSQGRLYVTSEGKAAPLLRLEASCVDR